MAPTKEGQSTKDESDKDHSGEASAANGVGCHYAQATSDPELDTACFSGSDGRIYTPGDAMRVLYQPNSSTPTTSSSLSQASPGTEGASCQPEIVICSSQTVPNTADRASSSLVEANTSDPQHTLMANSEHTSSANQRPSAPREARTAHPSQTGEPPPAGSTDTNPPAASLGEPLPVWTTSSSSAVSPQFCLLVALDDGTPVSFQSEYGRDLEGEIPQESGDSSSPAPLRELLSSEIYSNSDFFTEFESSPIPFTDIRDFDMNRMEMQSVSLDSAYFSNQRN